MRSSTRKFGTVLIFLLSAAISEPVVAAQPLIMQLPKMRPSTDDFDGMLKRRMVRILVPVSKTSFFLDKGTALGIEAELGQEFERWINKRYGNKKLKIHVGFVPTPRSRLLADLNEGKGDIAAGTLTVTPERQALVDFAAPWASGVKEVLVTGPAATDVTSLDDVGSRPIMVRSSSSYSSHLQELNRTRRVVGKPELVIKPADEKFEDEDLLGMVSAGMLPWAVVDRFKAKAWSSILKGLTVHDDIVIHGGGDTPGLCARTAQAFKRSLRNSSRPTRSVRDLATIFGCAT